MKREMAELDVGGAPRGSLHFGDAVINSKGLELSVGRCGTHIERGALEEVPQLHAACAVARDRVAAGIGELEGGER